MQELIGLSVPLILIVLGLVVGRSRERKHLANLSRRKAALQDLLVSDVKTYDPLVDASQAPALVVGEAVIATDYFKNVLAGLRNIFGGEVKAYLSLATRARQEALLRMLEEAKAQGCNAVCNVRLDAADIGANTTARGAPMVAMVATGTAYKRNVSAL